MSKRHKKHSTSVIIKTKDGAFLNLLKLTKLYKDQNLYAYKLFFNNLKLQMLDGAIINGVTGNPINPGVTGENIVGGLEITYHKDGMVMFKDVSRVQDKNLIREKHISLDRLGKPKIFFQTVGLPLRQLRKINFWGLQDNNSPLVRLDDYERQDYVNYFFYIGSIQNKAEITISEHTQHIFQDPFWFSLEDRKNNIMLYIFFLEAKRDSSIYLFKSSFTQNNSKNGKNYYCHKTWSREFSS